jgi:hypothetical protein
MFLIYMLSVNCSNGTTVLANNIKYKDEVGLLIDFSDTETVKHEYKPENKEFGLSGQTDISFNFADIDKTDQEDFDLKSIGLEIKKDDSRLKGITFSLKLSSGLSNENAHEFYKQWMKLTENFDYCLAEAVNCCNQKDLNDLYQEKLEQANLYIKDEAGYEVPKGSQSLNKIRAMVEDLIFASIRCGICSFILSYCAKNEIEIDNLLLSELHDFFFVISELNISSETINIMSALDLQRPIFRKEQPIAKFIKYKENFLPKIRGEGYIVAGITSIQMLTFSVEIHKNFQIIENGRDKAEINAVKEKIDFEGIRFRLAYENNTDCNETAFACVLLLNEIRKTFNLFYKAKLSIENRFMGCLLNIKEISRLFQNKDDYIVALLDNLNEMICKLNSRINNLKT